MNNYVDRLGTVFGAYLPNLLAALAILVLGTIAAWVIAAIAKSLLNKTTMDDKLASWLAGDSGEPPPKVEVWVSRIVFWLLMVFVLVAFFEVLGLGMVAGPLDGFLDKTLGFLPNLIGALALLGLAWIVARVLRFLVRKGMNSTGLQAKLDENTDSTQGGSVNLAKTLSESVYWLVFLLFLPAILETLELHGLLAPVDQLLREILAFLPNLLAAGLIIAIGWLLARVLQRVVTSLLAATGIDRVGERVGLSGQATGRSLSSAIGLVVYIVVLIPVIIAGLNALEIDALTAPASEMLNDVLVAVPRLFAAVLVVMIAYFVGKILAGFVANLLAAVGFDSALERIGLVRQSPAAKSVPDGAIAKGPAADASVPVVEVRRKPSEVAGYLVMVGLLLFATIEGLSLLEFDSLAALVAGFTVFAGNVLLGVLVFTLGLYLAGLAADAIRSSGIAQADTLATAARVAIIVMASAMALRQAGLGDDIIILTFGLGLGAIAVAAAIAFGIGGRDLAKQQLEKWSSDLEGRPNIAAPGGRPVGE